METQKKSEIKKVYKRFYEPECPVTRPVYDWIVDDKGHHKIKKIGEKNFDDEIQLWKDQTDIKILIDRLNKGDQATIIQLSQPMSYGDVNDYPQEVHPAASAMALHQLYENQPESVKKLYPTYELFAAYFTTLTNAMVDEMFKKTEEKKAEVNANE